MIKIQEHLNRPDAENYLDSLAEKMWNYLNIRLKSNSDYAVNSLIKKLDSLVVESKTPNYLKDIANNDTAILQRQQSFFKYLGINNYSKLKQLVVSRPDQLLLLKREILTILNLEDIFIDDRGVKQSVFGKLLLSGLFGYTNFRKSQMCFQLIIDINLQDVTCPYCNDNSISVVDISLEIDDDVINKAYLDLDHFYPKAQNPFFALSYFNLVPSCTICNSREKGEKEFCINTHIHPFQESFNDNYFFEINENSFIDGSTDYIKLVSKGHKIDYTDRDLRLNYRYSAIYLKKVNGLIKLYFDYAHYRNSAEFNLDYKEAVLQTVPIEVFDILNKTGGKLYRDVIKQIDAFNLIPN